MTTVRQQSTIAKPHLHIILNQVGVERTDNLVNLR